MANRVFQGVVLQMKDAVKTNIGIIDESGVVVASTDLNALDRHHDIPQGGSQADTFTANGNSYHLFSCARHNDYAAYAAGTDEASASIAAMLAIAMQNIRQFHDEKFDKTNFIKNVVMDNILPGDVFAKAREMHFTIDVPRVVLLIRVTNGTDISAYDVVSGLFPEKTKDFVFNISETDTVLVKELRAGIAREDIESLAASIADTLSGEHYVKSVVGIGSQVANLKDLATSFKEAQIALEVGKVFDTERVVVNYDNLGIARLIYQLPTTLCEMFLKEVFRQGDIDNLDDETLFTIQRFFENNLNVSETSRGLFVHRNTLVYRLEKIKKNTGLDLREFDDAIVFKVALMVKKYLTSNPTRY